MQMLSAQTPQQSLTADLIRFRPVEEKFDLFKTELNKLLENIDEADREKNQENHIRDFLLNAFYKNENAINGKGDIDLVIHEGRTKEEKVGVIIETKRPSSGEMISVTTPNNKALRQAILYFMQERVDEKNNDLKRIVITNIKEWFVFDAADFDKQFYESAAFRKEYEQWRDGKKVNRSTNLFYDEIAKPFLDNLEKPLECTHFNIKDYESAAEKDLIALYKILSPYYLLKKPSEQDSNRLDKNFYTELLHIIGLEETPKIKGKVLIKRKAKPDRGSLLEKAIDKIESKFSLFDQKKTLDFGATRDERIYNIALELCIVWTNRILFLKLLESQLLSYHENAPEYRFLHTGKINNFGELFVLFHDVLNTPINLRKEPIKTEYAHVPYLNSSLFDFAEVERLPLTINELDDNLDLTVPNSSILKKTGAAENDLPTLEYLFRFLDAYDFASEGKDDVQKENRSLINASVLGKVFEKINGYKDGSIYTPGFITMYMCRQAIRLAVVQKFRDEEADFDSDSFDDLEIYAKRHYKTGDIERFNRYIDELKLCDPAVGSGHFLVSALNEILAIKSELGIFADAEFKPFSQYRIKVANDEIVVTDRDNKEFRYVVRGGKPLNDEMQNLQTSLFHEKQKLIENCLFGVDINPNSVKICRLRLWIELLKNAYYKPAGYAELETLPNIDINIKQGNSLLSRFPLDSDLKRVLKEVKYSVKDYQNFVRGYKETRDRIAKSNFEEKIKQIKDDFKVQLNHLSPERIKLADLKNQLKASESKQFLFGESDDDKAERFKKETKLRADIEKRDIKIKAIEENALYKNAFEWRFEFPEVLDDDGKFLGFDIIIGNPPYISALELKKSISEDAYRQLKTNYKTARGTVDLFIYFFEKGFDILKPNRNLIYITPNRYLSASYGEALRELLFFNTKINEIIDYSHVKVFEEASTYPIVSLFTKTEQNQIYNFSVGKYQTELDKISFKAVDSGKLNFLESYIWGYLLNDKITITEKVINQSTSITQCAEINATSTASEADAYHDLINQTNGWKLINTGTIDRYESLWGKFELTDKGLRFLHPYLPKDSDVISQNRKNLFDSPKIIIAKIALTTEALLDENGGIASINTNCFHSFRNDFNEKYVLSWLNSKLFQYTFECFFDGLKMQGGYLLYSAPNLSKMFIKEISPEEQEPFIKLVDEILALKKRGENTNKQENEIDEMVYDLYELSEAERKIVKGETAAETVADV